MHKRAAFTLIELIVVMAMLSAVVALSAPRLSQFFSGRSLKEEARRLLAVVQYTRSEAVSSAIPLEVQINIEEGTYMILPSTGYEWLNQETKQYELEDNLTFDILSEETQKVEKGLARILFLPDGYLDDRSLQAIKIHYTDDKNDVLWIAQTELGVRYKILAQEELDEAELLRQ